MALQVIPGGFGLWLPSGLNHPVVQAFDTLPDIDVASEKAGVIFRVPKAGNIDKIHWGTRTVVTGATVDVRLESVDGSTGLPSGSLVGTDTNGAHVLDGADDNTVLTTSLTTDATVTMGQEMALVISNPAVDPGDFILTSVNPQTTVIQNFPYAATHNGTVWAKSATTTPIVFCLEYSDGTIVPIEGITPAINSITTTVFNNASTPDIYGQRFQVPFPTRVRGAWILGDIDNDCTLRLVNTAFHEANATGILLSATIDGTNRVNTSDGIQVITFDDTEEITKDTNYRLILIAGASNIEVTDWGTTAIGFLDGFPGGRNVHMTTAKTPTQDSDWTNYNSGTFRRILMGPIIDAFDDGVGSGASGGSFAFIG